MRYMVIVKGPEDAGAPPASLMDAIMQLGAEAERKGLMVQMGGLLPTALGTRVRIRKGKLVVSDGPFTESKEIVGGFAIYELESKDEALAWTRRFMDLHITHWPGWEGESEIRPMYEEGVGPEPRSA